MKTVALLSLLVCSSALAENPFECVSQDVTDAFLVGQWGQEQPTYSTDYPDNFRFEVPDTLEFVASSESSINMRIAFTSEQGTQESMQTMVDALQGAGWQKVEEELSAGQYGFQVVRRHATTTMCRENKPGLLGLMARESRGRSIVILSQRVQRAQTCADLSPPETGYMSHSVMHYLPRLSLPDEAKILNSSAGGSNDEASSRVFVSTALNREALLTHLGEQIRSQQWQADGAWSGSLSSGTTWRLTSEEDGNLVGMLSISQSDANQFDIRFSVSTVGQGQHLSTMSSFSSSG